MEIFPPRIGYEDCYIFIIVVSFFTGEPRAVVDMYVEDLGPHDGLSYTP